MELIEKINNMPIKKVMRFMKIFFEQYEQYDTNESCIRPYTYSKYGEKEYVELLSKSLTIKEMESNIKKMIPRTQYGVLLQVMKIAKELKGNL